MQPVGVVIVGAGGFGREVVDVIDAQFTSGGEVPLELVGLVDDGDVDPARLGRIRVPLLGSIDDLVEIAAEPEYLIGIGDGGVRSMIDQRLQGVGLRAATVRHLSCNVGRDVKVGPGSVLCAGSTITTNVRAGRHLHLNLASTIGHDCVLGDYVTISPGVNISGGVTVGDRVLFGTNSSVLPGVSIGADVRIGAGAMVARDVEAGATVVGVPARPR